MPSNFDKILSTFGYDALNMIFDISQESLPEKDRKKLVRLAKEQETNEEIRNKVQMIKKGNDPEKERVRLFLNLIKNN